METRKIEGTLSYHKNGDRWEPDWVTIGDRDLVTFIGNLYWDGQYVVITISKGGNDDD